MKNISLAMLFILVSSISFSQNQVISRLKQPPPNRLGIADLWAIDLNNTTRKDLKGYIVGTLSEDKAGLIVEAKSKLFNIKAGQHTYTQKDFSDADVNFYKNNYKETLLRTGGFPDGDYTICITVYNEDDDVIGMENCINHFIEQLGQISLILPEDGEVLDVNSALVFTWTPLPQLKPNQTYKLIIVETLEGQSPESAIEQNRPVFEKRGLKQSSYQLTSFDLSQVLRGKEIKKKSNFVWRVSIEDELTREDKIKSEPFIFTIKSSADDKAEINKDKIIFRFTVVYPEGEDSIINMFTQWHSDVRISGNAENLGLVDFLRKQAIQNLNNGVDYLPVIVSKQKTPCPPPGCGCDHAGAIKTCDCYYIQKDDACICNFCPGSGYPKTSGISLSVSHSISESGRFVNGQNDSIYFDFLFVADCCVKDIVNGNERYADGVENREYIINALNAGLEKIAELRKNGSAEHFITIKQKISDINQFTNKLIIDSTGNFIRDEKSLITALLPHSKPPDTVIVVLDDSSSFWVENIEWIDENNGQQPQSHQIRDWCACWCIKGKLFICSYPEGKMPSPCCNDCCEKRLHGPQPLPMPYDRTVPSQQLDEINNILNNYGLRIGSERKKSEYKINLNLIKMYENPEAYIACLQRDGKGNCIRWRICGYTNFGVYKCHEIYKHPKVGWVVYLEEIE